MEGFAVNGIANAALPALERQFKLPSTRSAIIPSSQDIGALIVVLFVSFIGGRYNKASWVASGSIIMAIGSFLFMVPHFSERYVYPGM
jgi:fucose permease